MILIINEKDEVIVTGVVFVLGWVRNGEGRWVLGFGLMISGDLNRIDDGCELIGMGC